MGTAPPLQKEIIWILEDRPSIPYQKNPKVEICLIEIYQASLQTTRRE